jgi:hypothetical protein
MKINYGTVESCEITALPCLAAVNYFSRQTEQVAVLLQIVPLVS